MITRKSSGLLFVAVLSLCSASKHFVRKCCPKGEQLAIAPEFEDTKVKCIDPGQGDGSTRQIPLQPFNTTSTIPKLSPLFPDNSPAPEGTFEVLVSSTIVCDGYMIKDPHQVKAIYTDGFAIDEWNTERPYDCVDFVFNSSDEHPTGIFCQEEHRPACPEDKTCLEKCCRHGKLLVKGMDRLECQESNHSMWSSNGYKQLLDNQMQETISLFYKRGNLQVCYTSSSEYEIQKNGSLFNHKNKSSTSDFCIDNYVDKPWSEEKEVVVTSRENCFKVYEEDEMGISGVLHMVATCISLVSLCLTILAYVLVPKYQNVKGKIVLVNVVFTSLLFGFLLLSYFTIPESFYLDCSTTNSFCEFLSKYSCPVIGYIGYFIYIATFTWITILGFNFFWNISSGLQPYDSSYRSDSSYGFLVQIATVPGFLALTVLLLVVQDLLDMPWPEDIFATHSAALSTMTSAIFWILALALDLMWTFTRDNAPAINSDNSGMRISSSVGLGLPLLLTAILSSLHAFLPRYRGLPSEAPWYDVLNPRMGQLGRCFISSREPLGRVLLLFHLPIFCIVLVNTFFFFIIVRRIFYTKRNSIIRNQNQAANELQEQMVLYCKLFLVFGISWSLEPVSMALSVFVSESQVAHNFTTITSILNLLRGLFMFLTFVSLKNIKNYLDGERWASTFRSTTKSTTTTTSASISRTNLPRKSSNK